MALFHGVFLCVRKIEFFVKNEEKLFTLPVLLVEHFPFDLNRGDVMHKKCKFICSAVKRLHSSHAATHSILAVEDVHIFC